MKREQLEHIIRAAAAVTNSYDIVVIGSQSILGAVPNAPAELTKSLEADVIPFDPSGPEPADLGQKLNEIDGKIGEDSDFFMTHGYYAQGVDTTTATLPRGWQHRLVRVQNDNTNGRAGWCLSPADLFIAKCVANREKDRDFNTHMLRYGIVTIEDITPLVADLPVDEERKTRIKSLITRLADAAR